jgi:hypothetical protein
VLAGSSPLETCVTVPHDPTATIVINKEWAARGQLHTAISLWFSNGDPVSIHTLAAAAQGILQGLVGKNHDKPHMREWIKKLSPDVRKKVRDPQNFFKHASTDPKETRLYQPYIGDLIIADAALLHQDLYGLTPGIRAFTIRLSFEQPGIFKPEELAEQITQGIRIDDLGSLERPVFLEAVLARFSAVEQKRGPTGNGLPA